MTVIRIVKFIVVLWSRSLSVDQFHPWWWLPNTRNFDPALQGYLKLAKPVSQNGHGANAQGPWAVAGVCAPSLKAVMGDSVPVVLCYRGVARADLNVCYPSLGYGQSLACCLE